MNEVSINSAVLPKCSVSIKVVPVSFGPALIIDSGASCVQIYPTRAELLALADMLREHAETMAEVTA